MKREQAILTLSWIIVIATLLVLLVSMNKFGVTGFSTSTDNGTVNLTITEQASLRFTTSTCDFGSGSVEEESLWATAWSNGSSINTTGGTGFQSCSTGLVLQNDGDIDISVALASSLTADEFIGGNQGTAAINVKSSDTTAINCTSGGGTLISAYEAIGSNPVCDVLAYKNETSEGSSVRVDFELVIPEDATPGAKGTVITATGTSA